MKLLFGCFFVIIGVSAAPYGQTTKPTSRARPFVRSRGRRADIWLDARRTGPRTLNWLLLEGLNFGHDVAKIEAATFNRDDPVAIAKNIQAGRNVFSVMGQVWTQADEDKLLEDRAGGPGPEIEIPLEVTQVR